MDIQTYDDLVTYLTTLEYPTGYSRKDRRRLIAKIRHLFVRDGQLYKRLKDPDAPPVRVLQANEVERILYNLHDDPMAGHFSFLGTYRRIAARYFWPQMGEDIKGYVEGCRMCQQFGGGRQKVPLHPIKPAQPFDRIGIDLVGPLPTTKQGNRYFAVATEYMTKWPEAKPIPTKTALEVATFLHEDILCRHGCPKEILSDQGKEFCNEVVNTLCQNFRIRHALSSPYHPQTNGLVERYNQTLCHTLAKYAEQQHEEWDKLISVALFAYRTRVHTATKHEPFSLVYGRNAVLPIEFDLDPYPSEPSTDETADLLRRTYQITERLPEKLRDARRNVEKSQDNYKQWYDGKIPKPREYKEGQKVWLYDALRNSSHSRKLMPKWLGPYAIQTRLSYRSYRLRNPEDGVTLPNTYHGSRLKPVKEEFMFEPVVIIEEEEL